MDYYSFDGNKLSIRFLLNTEELVIIQHEDYNGKPSYLLVKKDAQFPPDDSSEGMMWGTSQCYIYDADLIRELEKRGIKKVIYNP